MEWSEVSSKVGRDRRWLPALADCPAPFHAIKIAAHISPDEAQAFGDFNRR
jgi:hypothetical protein